MNKNIIHANREFTANFKFNKSNRAINHGHVNRIKAQMKESLGVMPPITVNLTTSNVIDGQHRLKAFQSLVDSGELPADSKLLVMLVEIPEECEKEAIVNANTNSKNWSLDDYIASYARTNDMYQALDDWCSNHTLCVDGVRRKYRYGAAMLKGMACSKELRNGSFVLSDADFERGEEIHAEILEILTTLGRPLKGNYFEYMAVAWAGVRDLHPFKDWYRELKSKKACILRKPYGNMRDWNDIFGMLHIAIDKKK